MISLRKRAEPVTLVRSPTFTNGMASVSVNGSRPESCRRGVDLGHDARLVRGDGPGDRRDMVRRGAAAAADDVDEAGARELADQPRHVVRRLVILAELVGQAGVRIGADQRVGDAADIGDVGAQILGAERAVEADRDRPARAAPNARTPPAAVRRAGGRICR